MGQPVRQAQGLRRLMSTHSMNSGLARGLMRYISRRFFRKFLPPGVGLECEMQIERTTAHLLRPDWGLGRLRLEPRATLVPRFALGWLVVGSLTLYDAGFAGVVWIYASWAFNCAKGIFW